MFVEINSKTFAEEPVQFLNLRFKNNVKIHTISEHIIYLLKILTSNYMYTFDIFILQIYLKVI